MTLYTHAVMAEIVKNLNYTALEWMC